MVFKRTIEEDIVGSTGVVKGGRAPATLTNRLEHKNSQYERLCSIRSRLGHPIAQRYGFTPTPDRSPMFLESFLVA
jgi:hypothetical protein